MFNAGTIQVLPTADPGISELAFVEHLDAVAATEADVVEGEVIGVGRLSKLAVAGQAEFALLVSDAWQGRGLGTRLLRQILQIAREEKIMPDKDLRRVLDPLPMTKGGVQD